LLLAKATHRWNELLAERFAAAGLVEVRPWYGSLLLPLYDMGKQAMTELIRRLEDEGLVERRPDPAPPGHR